MNSPSNTTASGVEHRKVHPRDHSKSHKWEIFLVVVTLVMGLGWIATSSQKYYKPGDDFGYNLGLVGGVMLLMLLLYPLRKRIRFLNGIGLLPAWFKWHMIFGILAPALILFHSTFRIGSINAGMALGAMLLVSGSGIFGRFFYTKIHNGLYGRKANLQELQNDLANNESKNIENKNSSLSFVPEIGKSLHEFSVNTAKVSKGGHPSFWHFATIGIKAYFLTRSLTHKLHHAMYSKARERNWNSAQMQQLDEMYKEDKKQIEDYIEAVCDVAQFHTYERLFSLWHIFHIPLVYILVFSGIYHVIAVHMY